MKKTVIWTLIVAALLVGSFALYISIQASQLPKDEIQKWLAIKKYIVLDEQRPNLQLYLKLKIDKVDAEKILTKYRFSNDYNKIHPFGNQSIEITKGKYYYFTDKTGELYGYVLVAVSKSLDEVEFLEEFGD